MEIFEEKLVTVWRCQVGLGALEHRHRRVLFAKEGGGVMDEAPIVTSLPLSLPARPRTWPLCWLLFSPRVAFQASS
ncbi:hypothetical protein E2C01_010369 [Portunus trituberculatus]|uniref:Uncharacterized protein n=1 Tax=Portunus trituberculatus TaxID=210409 RepID=A0A5B7D864_PORTR|nr:hypothetical protein [Portunus trituberculatus]